MMPVYRCDWCGKFYSSPLPDGTACPNHLDSYRVVAKWRREQHNKKIERERRAREEAAR